MSTGGPARDVHDGERIGRITHFTPNGRGGGRGKLAYLAVDDTGRRKFRTVEFSHGQCEDEDELPLPLGVYPKRGQVVEFTLWRRGRITYATGVKGKGGAPLLTTGTPIDLDAADGQQEGVEDMDFEDMEANPEPTAAEGQPAAAGAQPAAAPEVGQPVPVAGPAVPETRLAAAKPVPQIQREA